MIHLDPIGGVPHDSETITVDVDFAAQASKDVVIPLGRKLREVIGGRLYIDEDPGAAFSAWATYTFYDRAAKHGSNAFWRTAAKLVYTELEVATTGSDANVTPDDHADFSPSDLALFTGASQLLIDGDMEAAGVGAWTPVNNALLTKDTVNPHGGLQSLRIAYNGSGDPGARQLFVVNGRTYHISGWAHGDGTAAPYFSWGTGTIWVGTSSQAWQYFDEVSVATSPGLYLLCASAGACYCEFDDIIVTDIADTPELIRLATIADTMIAEDNVGAHPVDAGLVRMSEFSGLTLRNEESGTDAYLRVSFAAPQTVSLKMELLLRR